MAPLRAAARRWEPDSPDVTPAPDADRQGGFVLLDALVAVAVMAALLSVVPSSFVAAREIAGRSQAWLEARMVAEAVLAHELGDDLTNGSRHGSLSGRSWHLVVQPERGVSAASAQDGKTLLRIRMTVEVHGGRMLEIETLRIGGLS